MSDVNVLIVRAAGTNCDLETEQAWTQAGARPQRVHLRRLIEQPAELERFQILTLPGGFSYGDDIAAGRIFAAQLRRHLRDALLRFVDAGKLVLGICNGFQILVTAGLLPTRVTDGPRACSITFNAPAGFQDRWVNLRATTDRCAFLERGREYEMPIAHGEGRVVFADDGARRAVRDSDRAALTYVPAPADGGVAPGAPANPNGSTDDIAGLCDETGRVLGLMPHPERHIRAEQHPCWTRRPRGVPGAGLALFARGVAYFR